MRVETVLKGGGEREEAHLRGLWNFLLRNRLLAFGVPALMVAAAAVALWRATPIYDATVWIRIDEERSNLPVLDALKDLSSGSELATEMQVLRRRPLAEAVVDSLALQLTLVRPRGVNRSEVFSAVRVDRDAPAAEYRFRRGRGGRFSVHREGEAAPFAHAGVGEAVRLDGAVVVLAPGAAEHENLRVAVATFERTLKVFQRTVEVLRPDREADIVAVRYQSADRELVHEVPNTLARLFIRQRQEVKKADARSTVAFLGSQIDTLSEMLAAAEEDLREFRERENIVSLEHEGEAHVERLSMLKAERDLLEAERESLARLFSEIEAARDSGEARPGPSPYRRLMGSPSLLQNFAMSELFRSLAEVENERAELLNRRTPADPDVQVLTGRIDELEEQIRRIATTYLESLTSKVASLNETLAQFEVELGRVPAKEIEFARRFRRAEVLDEIFTLLQTRLQEAQIVANVDDSSVRVVEPAFEPLDPIKPNKPLSLVLAVVLGVILGVGTAFVRENMDDTLHTREELQSAVGAAPVIGLIPRIREVGGNGALRPVGGARRNGGSPSESPFEARLVTGRDPRNPVSEAYRSLRTNIAFSRLERPPKTLVFTSPTPGDGKSTTASNLAVTLAQQDLKCLLVDADLRRGFLNDVFRTPREPGLSNVLLGRADVEDAIRRVDLGASGTLDFLPTGTLPPNPAELVSSARMQALLERLASAYDAVILDAPPLTLVTDAALLGTYADGVVVVARAGVTERGAVGYAMEQLAAVRAPVLGAVLNDVDQKRERYYGSYSAGSYAAYYGVNDG